MKKLTLSHIYSRMLDLYCFAGNRYEKNPAFSGESIEEIVADVRSIVNRLGTCPEFRGKLYANGESIALKQKKESIK